MANSLFNFLNLSDLNGTNGFLINGIAQYDNSGNSVSNAEDINGDGIDDLIIGAYNADPNGNYEAGQSYVVFGGKNLGSGGSLNLSDLNGTNGFLINGIAQYDNSGKVSNAGDINGDGIDDLIIGAPQADPNGNSYAGQSYVVFGGRNLGSGGSLNLSDLNGTNGFLINGIAEFDFSGGSVSNAGDINGDGIDDLIIGASGASPNGIFQAGQSYVVFGGKNLGSGGSLNLSDLNGTNGFLINGIAEGDFSGKVSNAGDINGDGIDDLIIGASGASPNGIFQAGQSYVVFGGKNLGSGGSLNLSDLNGTNGFLINGIAADNYSGGSVSNAGDINGDGIDDLIIGASGADPNGNYEAGQSYVVFGGKNLGSGGSLNLSDLNGTNGFLINGIAERDNSGNSVSNAEDINGDGIDDLIIGASGADPNGNYEAGQSYVVFGGKNLGSGGSLNLSDLNGTNGFLINGIAERDFSGSSVSNAGDINGDGIDDLIIGARGASPNGISEAGQSYVVFGGKNIGSGSTINLTGTADADTLIGTIGNNTIDGKAANDTLTGNGSQDKFVFRPGDGNDTITDFGGVGQGYNPSQAVIVNVDTLQFIGSGLTAENLQLTPIGNNLEVTFENVASSKVTLQNLLLENLDNLPEIDSTPAIGNILFDGQTSITDSFDVINANSTQTSIFNKNTVTFLNELNNNIAGFDNSDDVINGQGGNDIINGLSGNDLLRGGSGDDILIGAFGNDTLVGGKDNDIFVGGVGADRFLYNTDAAFARSAIGVDAITDFQHCQGDKIVLDKTTFSAITSAAGTGFNNLSDFEVTNKAGTSTAIIVYDPVNGQLFYNPQGNSSGGLFATLTGAPTLTASDFVLQA
ncbi:Ca2+-binding protein, RTX toxin-related [Nostoc flagelliforme CCNUN1]|uniref:Ca2+-binding protein, RTX toxin-related n=1 Tax=Nostoc flagelliforme CCNUN1 TaxID=2038116 RepID=A0A2K8SP72_9NOSO|nr:FG-GAP repeat protein [Nostoc flagelliforme]AUB36635.1 Ca2+-binding protein, RTX toxin-related [Nostoc flagelliforme CCNUN1]